MKRSKTLFVLAGILPLILILNGCSPAKRASRLVNRARVIAPELFEDTTIVNEVEVITPERVAVATFPFEFDREFTAEQDGVKTTVVVKRDTVFVETVVAPDTVVKIVETKVEVIKPIPANAGGDFEKILNKFLVGIGMILVIILIIKLVK